MKKFDLFITKDNEIKYEKTYYFNNKTNEVTKVKHDSIILNPGDKTILKMLSKSNEK